MKEITQIREALEFARPFVSGYGWPSERHLPILDAAIAMCDKLEASKTDEQLYAEAMASVTPDALARMDRKVKAIDAMEAHPPVKVLTEEERCKMIKEYDDDLEAHTTFPVDVRLAMGTAYGAGLRVARDNGYLALAKVDVEDIMEVFDEAVEASIERGEEDEAQDWLDITDVGVEFRARLHKLLNP